MTPRRIGWFLSLQDVWLTTTAHIARPWFPLSSATQDRISDIHVRRDLWRCTAPGIHVRVHAPTRNTTSWTATNFLRSSGGPSEDVLHSSVTNATDFRGMETYVVSCRRSYLPPWWVCWTFAKGLEVFGVAILQFWYVIKTFSNLHPNVEVWKNHLIKWIHFSNSRKFWTFKNWNKKFTLFV